MRAWGRGVSLLSIIDLIRFCRNSWLILWAIYKNMSFFFFLIQSCLKRKQDISFDHLPVQINTEMFKVGDLSDGAAENIVIFKQGKCR